MQNQALTSSRSFLKKLNWKYSLFTKREFCFWRVSSVTEIHLHFSTDMKAWCLDPFIGNKILQITVDYLTAKLTFPSFRVTEIHFKNFAFKPASYISFMKNHWILREIQKNLRKVNVKNFIFFSSEVVFFCLLLSVNAQRGSKQHMNLSLQNNDLKIVFSDGSNFDVGSSVNAFLTLKVISYSSEKEEYSRFYLFDFSKS